MKKLIIILAIALMPVLSNAQAVVIAPQQIQVMNVEVLKQYISLLQKLVQLYQQQLNDVIALNKAIPHNNNQTLITPVAPANTNKTSIPMNENNSPAPAPVSNEPVASAPESLTPKIELINGVASVKIGETRAILAELKISDLDEDMQFNQFPVTITASDAEGNLIQGWVPEYTVTAKWIDLPNPTLTMKKGYITLVHVFLKNIPDVEGSINLELNDWKLNGVSSGDIRALSGMPISTTTNVVK